MEAAGLTVGVIALAGVFKDIIDLSPFQRFKRTSPRSPSFRDQIGHRESCPSAMGNTRWASKIDFVPASNEQHRTRESTGPFDQGSSSGFNQGILFISFLAQFKHIMMIVSSRPIPECVSAFSQHPHLMLDHLTRDDINLYVDGQLRGHPDVKRLLLSHYRETAAILDDIFGKGDGEGLADGDHVGELRRFVDALPEELGEMFERMLGRRKSRNMEQGAKILKICYYETIRSDSRSLDKFPFIGLAGLDENMNSTETTKSNRGTGGVWGRKKRFIALGYHSGSIYAPDSLGVFEHQWFQAIYKPALQCGHWEVRFAPGLRCRSNAYSSACNRDTALGGLTQHASDIFTELGVFVNKLREDEDPGVVPESASFFDEHSFFEKHGHYDSLHLGVILAAEFGAEGFLGRHLDIVAELSEAAHRLSKWYSTVPLLDAWKEIKGKGRTHCYVYDRDYDRDHDYDHATTTTATTTMTMTTITTTTTGLMRASH
ncbi:hypothetical protein QBC38DRAFT_521653 [Podospora fimiseda]|uniref:Uncharacterized protein n=1 Tax=Podospora fimiseda TaxID=252190 RepID=A0AAN6YLV4_9PEZI|nr:hypothetical protein QBC38DRAFT_521653 [Podospora fimiseda]